MENASNIFYYENSVDDKAIEALVAHEIAHQWFGDAATESNVAHVWLSEGFATYLTNYFHENKYGADSLRKRMAADRETIFRFEASRKTPVIDTTTEKEDITLLNPNSYQKGSWVLHMLRRKLGDAAFWKGIRTYYTRYRDGNASTDSLQAIMEQAGNQNLDLFFKQWLYSLGHPQLRISYGLNSDKPGTHLRIEQLQPVPFDFPLQIMIGNETVTINVNDKVLETDVNAVAGSVPLIPDPEVNLLGEFEVINPGKK
jgi:aminopeptidase N